MLLWARGAAIRPTGRNIAWPRGPMDKASAYGDGDCRFESCRGHFAIVELKRAGAGRVRILPAGFEPATYGS